jgi:hypothetical protein
MNYRSLLFLLLFVLVIFLVVKFDLPREVKIGVTNLIYGDEMRGIQGFRVSVDGLNAELEVEGLRREEVLQEIAAKIEKAGIKIIPDEEWRKIPRKAGLNVAIQAMKLEKQNYQYTITIEVTIREADNSASGSEKIKTIWSTYEMGKGDVSDIRKNINGIMDFFLKAHSGG